MTLQQLEAYALVACTILGALSVFLGVLGPALDKLATPGSRLDHFAKALTGVGLDIGKVVSSGRDALAKVPPPVAKAMLAISVAYLLTWSSPARAQQLTLGPSVPLVLVRPGDVHPVSLAPGAGISAGVDLFPSTVFGANVHLLSVGGDTFGSVQAATQLAGAGSISLHVTLAETLTLLAGLDLYRSDSTGLFASSFTSRNLFFGVGLDYAFIDRVFLGHQVAVVQPSAAKP